jgi:hypothetical protein
MLIQCKVQQTSKILKQCFSNRNVTLFCTSTSAVRTVFCLENKGRNLSHFRLEVENPYKTNIAITLTRRTAHYTKNRLMFGRQTTNTKGKQTRAQTSGSASNSGRSSPVIISRSASATLPQPTTSQPVERHRHKLQIEAPVHLM